MTFRDFLFKQKMKITSFSTKMLLIIFLEKLTVSEISALKRTHNFELLRCLPGRTLRAFTHVRADKLSNILAKNAYFLIIQSPCERWNLSLSPPVTWITFSFLGHIGKTGQTSCSGAISTPPGICSYFFCRTLFCFGLS